MAKKTASKRAKKRPAAELKDDLDVAEAERTVRDGALTDAREPEIAARVPETEEGHLADAGTVQRFDREVGLENPPEEASLGGDVDTGQEAQREVEKRMRKPAEVSHQTNEVLNLLRRAHTLAADGATVSDMSLLDEKISEVEHAVKRGIELDYDHKALRQAVSNLEHGGHLRDVFVAVN